MDNNSTPKTEQLNGKSILIVIAAFVVLGLIAIAMPRSNPSSTSNTQLDTKTSTPTSAPTEKYKELETMLTGSVGASKHYLYIASAKPTYEDVKSFVITEHEKGCGKDLTVCNFYLWDNKDACRDAIYGNDDLLSGDATEIATKNKEHLAGYVNSGDMVFYYGITGNGSENSTTIYDGAKKEFIIF